MKIWETKVSLAKMSAEQVVTLTRVQDAYHFSNDQLFAEIARLARKMTCTQQAIAESIRSFYPV